MRFIKLLTFFMANVVFSIKAYACNWALHPYDCARETVSDVLDAMGNTADEGGSFARILRSFRGENSGCWFCSLFNELFNTINSLTRGLSGVLTQDGLRLLWLGLSFYILFKVLKAVISFGEINPKEFFTDLFMPVLKCLVAVAILANLGNFYTRIVNPLAGLSIGFSTEISSSNNISFTRLTSNGGRVQQSTV